MPQKDDRLNVRVPAQLKADAAEYAGRKNMTLSQLVVLLLSRLIAHDKNSKDADQI